GPASFREPRAVLLYDGGLPLNFRERLTDALRRQLDLVRRTNIDQEDVIFAVLHQFTQSRLQLGTTPARKTALENGKLNPVAISVHCFENTAPAPLIGDVIGDNEQAFVGHWIDLGIGLASTRQIVR